MIKVDWLFLRAPIIMLTLALLVAATLIFAAQYFEQSQFERYQKSLSTLRTTHRLYKNIVNDIDLLDQYRALYSGYRSSGLVGDERRLSWIESLESTNKVLMLPTLTYNLLPQEDFKRPGFKVKRGVDVNSSPMELTIGMLHEEDLFALLEGLRLSIDNLFAVEGCTLIRSSAIGKSLDTKRDNLVARCRIRWVTINAK